MMKSAVFFATGLILSVANEIDDQGWCAEGHECEELKPLHKASGLGQSVWGSNLLQKFSSTSIATDSYVDPAVAPEPCKIDPSHPDVDEYCRLTTMAKSLVTSGDCVGWWYGYGSHDNDVWPLKNCRGWGCHVVDRSGSKCFTCDETDYARISGNNHAWHDYCAARTPKYWFMAQDCSTAHWGQGTGDNDAQGQVFYSYNGDKCPRCTGVKGDMRCHIQACLQYETLWCWATAVIVVAGYYHPDQYPNHDDTGANCRGAECRVVGAQHNPDDPDMCCRNKNSCNRAGTGKDITDSLLRFTGFSWKYLYLWGKSYTSRFERLLTQILQDSHPVIFGIAYPDGGGHIMVIAGTDGNGIFYVHDPFNIGGRDSFQLLTYGQIVNYQRPAGYAEPEGSGTMDQAYVPSQYIF